MSDDRLGKLIATGRTAEVYEWGEDQVVKLLRDGFDAARLEKEAKTTQTLQGLGLPVPGVAGGVVEVAGHPGLILEKVDGPSMLQVMFSRPWQLLKFARTLASLHAAMHGCPAEGLPSARRIQKYDVLHTSALNGDKKEAILTILSELPVGDRVCHGDFHPGNVLMSSHGPVIIDWTDSTSGNPLADVARTSLLNTLAVFNPEKSSTPSLVRVVRNLFNTAYLRHYFKLLPQDRTQFKTWQTIIAALRLNENVPGERDRLLAVVDAGLSSRRPN